ncbi:unnamed protein product [Camellia sinensis]
MASLNLFFSLAVTNTGRVYVATVAKCSSESKEKNIIDMIIGGLQKEDQRLETDPILKKVEENNGGAKNSVAVPPKKKKNNGGGRGFGGLSLRNEQ